MTAIFESDHADYLARLHRAAAAVFPVLCFDQIQTDSFLHSYAKSDNSRCFTIETEGGTGLVCVRAGRNSTLWSIRHVVPNEWDHSYTIVAESLERIKERARREGVGQLLMTIEEDIPSHNAYFAGMLPSLGFTITPRIVLTAPLDTLAELELRNLPPDIDELVLTKDRLEEAIKTFMSAFAEQDRFDTPEERDSRYKYFRDRFSDERYAPSWVALQHENRIVAVCFGCEDTWTKTLDLVEVAVLPSYRRRGLGRYVCIRCMQKLCDTFTSPEREFLVETDRTNLGAIRLYKDLGFTVHQVIDYASIDL